MLHNISDRQNTCIYAIEYASGYTFRMYCSDKNFFRYFLGISYKEFMRNVRVCL